MQKSSIPLTLANLSQADQPLIFANRAFEKLTEYGASEILGKNCRFLQGSLDQPIARSDINDAIATKTNLQIVLKNFTKSGKPFDNLLFLYPVSYQGEPRFFLGSQFALQKTAAFQSSMSRAEDLSLLLADLQDQTDRLSIQNKRVKSDTMAMLVSALFK